MKLMHLADLHIGKRVAGYSMLEDQKYILGTILDAVKSEQPDAVLIAGDVYDRTIPSEEAVTAFDDFVVGLAGLGTQVIIISGNHDSAQRVAFGGRLMKLSGVHFSPVFSEKQGIEPVHLSDEHGPVTIWPIPFLKPADVKEAYKEQRDEIGNYTDAMRVVIAHLPINAEERNVAVVHQFITGAAVCDSEEKSVGGLDDISAEVFDAFDYVALGHLHGPQSIGREGIRYAGSPLKYSFSELNQVKSITMVELGEKGDIAIGTLLLKPLHDWQRFKGTFAELVKLPATSDYCECILTDEQDVPMAISRLQQNFENLMGIRYDNKRTRNTETVDGAQETESKSDTELFEELFRAQQGRDMTEEELAYFMSFMEAADRGDGEEA